MSVPYERYNDDIEAAEQSSLSSEENHATPTARPDVVILQHKRRYQELFRNRWPKQVGIVQLAMGFLTGLAAVTNVIVLPLVLTIDDLHTVRLDHSNLYGLGIWAGFLLVVTGSLGLRAGIYKSVTTVYIYFANILVDIPIIFAFIVMILIGYSSGWTTKPALWGSDALFYTHLTVCVLVGLDFILLLVAFTQYYEDVFFGELHCLRRAIHCCMPCWCPRVVEPEELMSEHGRPPSLPV